MMQSICFDTSNAQAVREVCSNSELCSGPARRDSFYTKFASGNVRETIASVGSTQGILQLDCEIEARLGNLQHDASKLVSKAFKWTYKGIPSLAKKSASIADYYFFSKWYVPFLLLLLTLPSLSRAPSASSFFPLFSFFSFAFL
eukprot:Phypoly_transcript_17281.p1 GENE.Phypoly_transcript_17281~~Phypoly_transcript_17281.p1  ORF type:complete len:144 (-),score=12.94 Phypoly_transcript_17281:207-638(-)